MVFLNYDQAELDRQYDQRAWAPNAAEVIRRYTENSDRVRARLGAPDVFAYGPSAAETFDLYRCPNDNAPIQVFIHGGAWRLLGKRDSAFAAETFVRAGAHFVALDFALLPSVTLAEMVAQVRRGVAWIHQNAARFGGDPARLHISGHSSGGHLAGCVAVTDWQEYGGAPLLGFDRLFIKAHGRSGARAIANAGIYDFAAHHDLILEPVVLDHWALESVEGLSPAAEQARERCLRHIAKVARAGRRASEHRESRAHAVA